MSQSRHDAVGAPPGTLSAAPDARTGGWTATAYSTEHHEQVDRPDAARRTALRQQGGCLWLDLDGAGHVDLLGELQAEFQLSRLALEDVLNIPQRPKVEIHGDHMFIVLHMPSGDDVEQVSLFVGDDWIITIQERPGDCFTPVRQRLKDGRQRIRGGGSPYLAYALVDAIIDAFSPRIADLRDRLDALEDEASDGHFQAEELHRTRRELTRLRRSVGPMRDLSRALQREDSLLATEYLSPYLRDCEDHATTAADAVDALRDTASHILDLHLALQGQRMNEIMKVLTVISTIFIPLSFIAGLYGMNFERSASRWNMPELGWTFGYPFAVGLMAGCVVALLLWFRRKGWFS